MKLGDLVTTIKTSDHDDKKFGAALVVGWRWRDGNRHREEVEVLLDDGETLWFPYWMMKVVSACG